MIANAQAIASELLSEKNLWRHTLFEDYLTVNLNIRRCSLMTIPAELPDASSISRRIDDECRSDFGQLKRQNDPSKRVKAVRSLKEKLRRAYFAEIKHSPSYGSHMGWMKRLGLQFFEVEVRPTVREHFIYKQKETRDRIENLTRKRLVFREEFLKHADPSLPRSIIAYPEERFPEYLDEVGELLEYPKCCVEAYIENRMGGGLGVEQRAADQIANARAEISNPDIFSYFSKDFIPCSPKCSNASAIGRRIHQTLKDVDERLSEAYVQCLRDNIERVGLYVQNIQAHKARMESRSRELGIGK